MGVGGRQSVERRRATASSGGDAGEYPLDVPGHGDEAPFAGAIRCFGGRRVFAAHVVGQFDCGGYE